MGSLGNLLVVPNPELPARSGHFQVTSSPSPILSLPSPLPHNHLVDPITTRTRKSREPEILFLPLSVMARLLCVCVSL